MLFFIDSVGLVGSDVIAGVVPGVAGIDMVGVIVGAVGVFVVINVNVDELQRKQLKRHKLYYDL